MSNKHELIEVLGKQNLMNTTEFWEVMKGAVVPSSFSDEQTMVFLAVANSLNLNPLNGEVYPALVDGRVASLVGIDGWIKRSNEHPEMDGMEIEMASDGTWCTVTIHRKDRRHPTIITEYLSECRKPTGPWKTHPKRMLRHRAIIQGVRVAFGSGGAIDPEDVPEPVPADGVVIEDAAPRAEALTAKLQMKVKETEPTFRTIQGFSCAEDGCRKRLVMECAGACGELYCEEHMEDHGAGLVCDTCAGDIPAEAEVEPIDPERADTIDQEPDPSEGESGDLVDQLFGDAEPGSETGDEPF